MFITPRIPSPLAGLKEPPSRLLIAKWGKNEGTNGTFTVGPKTKKFLPALQKLLGFDTVKLDFEHNTVPGTEAYKADKEPRNIAADARLEVVEGEGIYAHAVQWTPHGVKSITEGLHSDLSPTIKTDDDGEVVFVHSAALCRQGSVPDLRVYSAGALLSPAQLACFSATINPPPSAMDYKKLLTLLLGLDANAADADIETAAKKFAETTQSHATSLANLNKTLADLQKSIAAAPTAHSADALKKVDDAIAALNKRLDDQERAALTAQALAAGKLIPNSAAELGIEQFRKIVAELPADQVPVSQRTPEGIKTFSVATPADSTSEIMRKRLGISKEEWAKHAAA